MHIFDWQSLITIHKDSDDGLSVGLLSTDYSGLETGREWFLVWSVPDDPEYKHHYRYAAIKVDAVDISKMRANKFTSFDNYIQSSSAHNHTVYMLYLSNAKVNPVVDKVDSMCLYDTPIDLLPMQTIVLHKDLQY